MKLHLLLIPGVESKHLSCCYNFEFLHIWLLLKPFNSLAKRCQEITFPVSMGSKHNKQINIIDTRMPNV